MHCENKNSFCFVCALWTPRSHAHNITKQTIGSFEFVYRLPYIPERWYVPEVICEYCYRALLAAKANKPDKHPMKFVLPAMWMDVWNHDREGCYFCLTMPKTGGFNFRTREQLQHAVVDSVVPPLLRSNERPHAPFQMTESNTGLFSFPLNCIFVQYCALTPMNSFKFPIRSAILYG